MIYFVFFFFLLLLIITQPRFPMAKLEEGFGVVSCMVCCCLIYLFLDEIKIKFDNTVFDYFAVD